MRTYQIVTLVALAGCVLAGVRRQTSQCTTAADCTCADNQVADCHHGHCTCHYDGGHHPFRRADCHNGHQCTCSSGQTGVCNDQGHCDCGNNGKRQSGSQCTSPADCTGCSDNQVAECHNGHCTCHHDSNHHPFRRAVCHNGHQCTCSNGQTGVCNDQGHCDCGNNGKRQTDQCTTAADCTCADNQVADCHHGHCTCHYDGGHHPFRRAVCHNGHQCTCSSGQTGVCNDQGHCDCGNNGKRQTDQCTTAADCTCADNQVADCHHGHCTCHYDGGHHPFRRAVCHNGHQCTCSNGQTGVCNDQGHCDCGNNGKRQTDQCTTAADCTCADNQVADCHHGHCTCHYDGGHHPFRRAVCHNGHQCTCSSGQTGVCNDQGHCDCGNNGKRQTDQCTTAADCTCADNQAADCHHGHCTCHYDGGHHPFRRAVCHNGHQCTCSNGQTGVCNDQGHCDCGNNGKRQTDQCTTAADCTCADNQVADCHHGHCTCHYDGGHHPFRRAVCHNGHQCTCSNGQTGVCNDQGHCDCGNNGKRQTSQCTTAADCTCADNQVADCHHGHCTCHYDGGHHPFRRAVCHNGHQCTCSNGQTGVCNDQGHCDCGNNGKRQSGSQCTSPADCTGCSDNQVAECHNGHCTCHHDSNHHPFRYIRQTMCTVDDNCTCAGAHEVAFCENGNCHCRHEENHHNPGNHHPGRRQNDACTTVDDCTCGAHEVASCDSGKCHCHHDGNTGNHNPPHHPRAVYCNNNSDCSAHCDPHNGDCINNQCHCRQHA